MLITHAFFITLQCITCKPTRSPLHKHVTCSSYMIGCLNNGNDIHIYIFFLISILIEIENQLSLNGYQIASSMVVKGFLIVIVLINFKLASATSAAYRK